MTRDEAEEILLNAGWLGIMCRELSDKKLIEAAKEELRTKEQE